jgi:hypothetical protein
MINALYYASRYHILAEIYHTLFDIKSYLTLNNDVVAFWIEKLMMKVFGLSFPPLSLQSIYLGFEKDQDQVVRDGGIRGHRGSKGSMILQSLF